MNEEPGGLEKERPPQNGFAFCRANAKRISMKQLCEGTFEQTRKRSKYEDEIKERETHTHTHTERRDFERRKSKSRPTAKSTRSIASSRSWLIFLIESIFFYIVFFCGFSRIVEHPNVQNNLSKSYLLQLTDLTLKKEKQNFFSYRYNLFRDENLSDFQEKLEGEILVKCLGNKCATLEIYRRKTITNRWDFSVLRLMLSFLFYLRVQMRKEIIFSTKRNIFYIFIQCENLLRILN